LFRIFGASGSVVLKALCYKPEGYRFEARWGQWFSSIYLTLPAALGPGLCSDSNRNEYQKKKNECFWGVKWGGSTLPPSVSRLIRQCCESHISQPYRPPWPVAGIALLYFTLLYFTFVPNICLRTLHDCKLPQKLSLHFSSPSNFVKRFIRILLALCQNLRHEYKSVWTYLRGHQPTSTLNLPPFFPKHPVRWHFNGELPINQYRTGLCALDPMNNVSLCYVRSTCLWSTQRTVGHSFSWTRDKTFQHPDLAPLLHQLHNGLVAQTAKPRHGNIRCKSQGCHTKSRILSKMNSERQQVQITKK
jgi:hypothetical protein